MKIAILVIILKFTLKGQINFLKHNSKFWHPCSFLGLVTVYSYKSGCTELQFLLLFIIVLFHFLFLSLSQQPSTSFPPRCPHSVFSSVSLHSSARAFPFCTLLVSGLSLFLSHPACSCPLCHFPPPRTLSLMYSLISTSIPSSAFLSTLPLPYFLTTALLSLSPEGNSITLVEGVCSQSQQNHRDRGTSPEPKAHRKPATVCDKPNIYTEAGGEGGGVCTPRAAPAARGDEVFLSVRG